MLLNAVDESTTAEACVDDSLAADVLGTPCTSEDVATEALSEALLSGPGLLLVR